jgi:hypothetical protein
MKETMKDENNNLISKLNCAFKVNKNFLKEIEKKINNKILTENCLFSIITFDHESKIFLNNKQINSNNIKELENEISKIKLKNGTTDFKNPLLSLNDIINNLENNYGKIYNKDYLKEKKYSFNDPNKKFDDSFQYLIFFLTDGVQNDDNLAFEKDCCKILQEIVNDKPIIFNTIYFGDDKKEIKILSKFAEIGLGKNFICELKYSDLEEIYQNFSGIIC